MARQKGVLPFTGPLGDRVGYRRNGEYFLRRKALHVRQSAATKLAAKDFGSASRGGAQLRHALHAELHRYYDYDLITRLNKALTGIIRNDQYRAAGERRLHVSNMQGLCTFRFNDDGCHQHLLSCTPDITEDVHGTIQLSFSDLRPKAPMGVTHLTIKAIVVSADFERNAMEVSASATVTMANRKQCSAITLAIDPVQGICAARKGMRIVLVEVQPHIQVNGQLLPSGNKQGYALDVIAVLPPVGQFVKVRPEHKNKAPKLKVIPGYENRSAHRIFKSPLIAVNVDLELLSLLCEDD
jgi:hypothetical protein